MKILSMRLDKQTEKELNYIVSRLNKSQSQVIKEAIHAEYETLVEIESRKSPADIFSESKYISSFKGEKNLSVNYKEKLYKESD